jgi:RNA polymerase sigma-70 factor (ECF subfamily)
VVASFEVTRATIEEADLYERFGRRVFLFGLRHLRSRYAAEDLVQQVLVTTIEKLRTGGLRDPDKLGSFVLGMSRTMIADARRGERRRAELLGRHAKEWEAATAPIDPPDDRRLSGCLEALPQRERAVVVMSYYADRSSSEIAAELTMTAVNVRVVKHRALAHLRDCLETPARGERS